MEIEYHPIIPGSINLDTFCLNVLDSITRDLKDVIPTLRFGFLVGVCVDDFVVFITEILCFRHFVHKFHSSVHKFTLTPGKN